MKYFLIVLLFAATACTSVSAQNFGHINSAELLSELPRFKEAEKQLETYGQQLERQLKAEVDQLQADYQAIMEKIQGGTMTPLQQQQEEASFQQRQQELAQKEQNYQRDILAKRDELVQPILTDVQVAIDAVAAEKGLTYVFDLSTGSILYSPPSDDISAAVIAKL